MFSGVKRTFLIKPNVITDSLPCRFICKFHIPVTTLPLLEIIYLKYNNFTFFVIEQEFNWLKNLPHDTLEMKSRCSIP